MNDYWTQSLVTNGLRGRALPHKYRTGTIPRELVLYQNMIYFTSGKARYILENSPIRVIFNQGPGIDVFHRDGAFAHLNAQHKDRIAKLGRFQFVFDVLGEGIYAVQNQPSEGELLRFGVT